MTLLDTLRGPTDLRSLPDSALPDLAAEIRERLVETVTRAGGHLGPNLGVVELTLALHRVFESPRDLIVWDTGHQTYVHKMLTGRVGGFVRLREAGGLSGYPNRAESPHDLVENSHASTALSYADGLAKALEHQGRGGRAVVAVVGDGSLTGGLAWEALNNIGGAPERPVVVVLNDNGRSYSPTVGGLAAHLWRLRSGREGTTHCEQPSVFEQLGFAYLGPVDGHDVAALQDALTRARRLGRPVVVHCLTTKGKGYLPAESDEVDHCHTVPPRPAGAAGKSTPPQPWTDVVGDELVAIAQERADVVALTAAMLHPTGLHELARKYPERVFDVGIAEQHAVTSAAGLAMGGLHPVVCVYGTFLNRAFDQVLMDVALHRLPVTFVLDRCGVTGNDGPSHHGMWDLSLLGLVPGLRVAAPRDAERLRQLLREAVADDTGPTAVRFPKGDAGGPVDAVGTLGGADLLAGRADAPLLLLGVGACARPAAAAVRLLADAGVDAAAVDPLWTQPVSPPLLDALAGRRLVVTVEDNGLAGGFGDAVARGLRTTGAWDARLLTLGLPQQFLAHGSRDRILAEHGLDAAGIARSVLDTMSRSTTA